MREEALMPFDVHVHPRSDGGIDLLASAGPAGVWGQANDTCDASLLARIQECRADLDDDDRNGAAPGAPPVDRPHHHLWWCAQHGANVFRALLPDKVQDLYRTCLEQARRKGQTLSIRVRYNGTTDRQLHDVPWELAFDPDEQQFLALWPETCLARYLHMPHAERPVQNGPRRLLLTMAKSTPQPEDFKDECARIGAVTRRVIQPTTSYVTGSTEIWQRLTSARDGARSFLAWHHVGHGRMREETGKFALEFNRDGRDVYETSLADLVAAVAQSGIRCAVLNICYSGRTAGLATAIASANVPIVIGHRTAVYDRAAVSFAATLWRELAAGSPAELAIRTARMSILSKGWGSQWVLPMLFVRTNNTHLVEEDA